MCATAAAGAPVLLDHAVVKPQEYALACFQQRYCCDPALVFSLVDH
jgi:hypothetical protein